MPSELRVDKVSSTASPYEPVFSTTGGALSHRNMMINGAMLVDQRNAGALATNIGATDNDYRTVDRWRNVWTGGEATRISLQQVSITDLAGFSKAMKIDCVTAEGGTQDADESFRMAYKFEGQDLQGLEKGFSTAKSFTISFWVKGTASRTYVLELKDSDNSRHLTQQFSVTASWVKHTYTIPADTTGKITSDNTEGLELNLWFFAGTNYQGGTYTANTWKTTTTNQRATGISDSGKGLLTTTNDEVYFTGFQMELGSVATPFEHRRHSEELQNCMRYFQRPEFRNAFFGGQGQVRGDTGTTLISYAFPVRMRGIPSTITTPTIGQANGNITFLNGEAYPSSHGSVGATETTADHICMFFGSFSSLGTAHTNCWAYVTNNSGNNNAFFEFEAEL